MRKVVISKSTASLSTSLGHAAQENSANRMTTLGPVVLARVAFCTFPKQCLQ